MRPDTTRPSGTSTLPRWQPEGGWAGRTRPATGDALWLKRRWAATRPSSAPACERVACPANGPKRPSAWPCSTACCTLDTRTPSGARNGQLSSPGKGGDSSQARAMQQRPAAEPDTVLLDFLSTTYVAAAGAGGWDRAARE